MRTVVLGKESPLTVSAVGLGCMGMVSAYPPIQDKKDMIRFARQAFEQGETFLILPRFMALIPARKFWEKRCMMSGIRYKLQPSLGLIFRMGFLSVWIAARRRSERQWKVLFAD